MSFSIPFAFAMGALITGRLGGEWLRPVRLWTMLAWAIQGMGLLVGAWWAYHVLGWGGYWGWDPVENVALLPWLISTALLHSFMVQEKRGMLKLWNLGLVIAAFSLSIFGTFVVRSGIIVSVHSFATSAVGPYFFVFLGLALLGAIALVGYRLPMLRDDGAFDSLASREAAFLLNNLLLVCIAAATFWGTIFPIVSEAVRGAKIAVGPPFYVRFNGPLLVALLLLMGLGPLLGWRRTSSNRLVATLRWPVAIGAAVSIILLLFGIQVGLALVGLAAAAMVAATIFVEFERGVRVRRRGGEEFVVALRTLISRDRRRYGGYLVHLAMVLIAVGVIGSTGYQQLSEQQLAPGGQMTVGRYTLINQGLRGYERPGMQGVVADIGVRAFGQDLGLLHPEKRAYANWERQPVTGVAIRTVFPWLDDVYVLMSGLAADGTITLRVYVNPLVSLIWLGGALFLASTLIAAWPSASERRAKIQPVERREVARSEAS
jgi:cytochrome c-type biogenesis protein CcmF